MYDINLLIHNKEAAINASYSYSVATAGANPLMETYCLRQPGCRGTLGSEANFHFRDPRLF